MSFIKNLFNLGKVQERGESIISSGSADLTPKSIFANHSDSFDIDGEKDALTLSPVYRSLDVISSTFAQLPIEIKDEVTGLKSTSTIANKVGLLLSKSPNKIYSSHAMFKSAMVQLMSWGNAYIYIFRGRTGGANKLKLIPSSMVSIYYDDKEDELVYKINKTQNSGIYQNIPSTIPAADMLHFKGFSDNGIEGKSVFELAASSMGVTFEQQKYEGSFYKNQARPTIILTAPPNIKGDQMKDVRDSWNNSYGGANKFKTAVLGGNWGVHTFSIPNEAAQFLQSRNFSILEVARWFGLPPHLLYNLENASYNNTEQQSIEFAKYTLLNYVKIFESEIDLKILKGNEYARFGMSELLRGDTKTRIEYYKTLWNVGAISANDILKAEEKQPFKEGDRKFIQRGFAPLDRVDEIIDKETENGKGKEA